MSNPRTMVYIDGFNLYYGAVKGTPYKWLDLFCLSKLLLPNHDVLGVKYFTAMVSGKEDPKPNTPEICSVLGCNWPAKWQDALHGHPIAGRKWCTSHATCYRSVGSVVPYYGASPKENQKRMNTENEGAEYPPRTAQPTIEDAEPFMMARQTLLERIKDYLASGGLFNPEMMEHNKVRDLLIDCQKYIESN